MQHQSHMMSLAYSGSIHAATIRLVLEKVRASTYGDRSWLVGGNVRDWLLCRNSADIDLAVPGGAISMARTMANSFGGDFFVLDREREVARAIFHSADGNALTVDIATLRAGELAGDLSLRDFTINAMALPVGAALAGGESALGEIVDLFGGRRDLVDRLVRAVSEGSFSDDPLRMLRAVRQSAELDFRIEDATYNLVRRDAHLLPTVAAERVRDELSRLLCLPGGWRQLPTLVDTGLLGYCVPEVMALVGVEQSYPHFQDVFEHTRSVLAHLEGLFSVIWPAAGWKRPQRAGSGPWSALEHSDWADLEAGIRPFREELSEHLLQSVSGTRDRRDVLLWAALAHDWGKPDARSLDDAGRARFFGHDALGAQLAEARLRALRLSAEEGTLVSRLVGLHMRPAYLSQSLPPSRRAMYRFFVEAGDIAPESVLLSLADYAAIQAGNSRLEGWEPRIGTAKLLLEVFFRKNREQIDPPLLLDGRQIMSAFGLPPGRQVGRLLRELREAQALGEVTEVEQALAFLAERVGTDQSN